MKFLSILFFCNLKKLAFIGYACNILSYTCIAKLFHAFFSSIVNKELIIIIIIINKTQSHSYYRYYHTNSYYLRQKSVEYFPSFFGKKGVYSDP